MKNLSASELNTVKELLGQELKNDFSITSTSSTNVLATSSLKDAKIAVNLLDMLTYKAILHNPSKSIIEVIFN